MTVAAPVARDFAQRPRLERLAPLALALVAVVVYVWELAASGYANTYYSAAAQAAAQSWSAMFFGAIDAAGFITVDKPPASLWAMGLSVRILGLSPFAVLLPEALAGWQAMRHVGSRFTDKVQLCLLAQFAKLGRERHGLGVDTLLLQSCPAACVPGTLA